MAIERYHVLWVLPCTRFPTPRKGWLVSTGRPRLMKIAKFTAVSLLVLALLVVAAISGGVGAMVCNLMVDLAAAVMAGSRVEGSTSSSPTCRSPCR